MSTFTVMKIAAFYRNDGDRGFQVELHGQECDSVWRHITRNVDKCWMYESQRGSAKELIARVTEELERHGRDPAVKGKPVSLEVGGQLVGDVYLLEKYGGLKPDEYNGLVVCGRDKSGIVHIINTLATADKLINALELRDGAVWGHA